MPRRSSRQLGLATVALSVGWLLVGIYSAFTALPDSPIRLPFAKQVDMNTWMPQGWGFFTRDPREDRTLVLVQTNGTWKSAYLAPHARFSNVLGLDRASRGQGVELGEFMHWMKLKTWARCKDTPVECLDRVPVFARLENKYPRPTLCGTIGLVVQKPVPWAWSRMPTPVIMPSVVAKLEVVCST
ncbi:MAG TPA: SdpA family antimicrobial peptide system protein [Gemmatimonadaceae bacterium]|jgi:antimicrobial peptide system SdpA family protein